MFETKDVFSRTRDNSRGRLLSESSYNICIGLTLLWGFGVNYLMVLTLAPESALQFGYWTFLILYFASCFLGVYLFTSSDKPLVSFIGYNFVVVPFGFIVNLVVSAYSPDLVLEAVQITGVVTVLMMVLGSIFPKFFQKIHVALVVSLLLVIVVELVDIFFLGGANRSWIDWVVALIFCGYIGYDWGRANRIPNTLDNAIDSAAALYIDIINIFIRILSILGRRK